MSAATCKLDKVYKNLVAAYREPTKFENRVINQIAYKEIAKITEHNCPEIYDLIWNFFIGATMPNLKKPIVMSKPGIKGTWLKQTIDQGEHIAPMRHTHAVITEFWAYNPIHPRFTWSKYHEDRPQFQSDEDVKRAYEADVHAAEQAFKEFRKMIICLFFQTVEEWKKFECVGESGKEVGINQELHDLWFKLVDGSNPSNMQGLSIEKNFLCYKDGKPVHCCKTSDASCTPYKDASNHLNDTLHTINAIVKYNEIAGVKSGHPKNGNDESKKLYGWIETIKAAISELTTTRTTKYNIGTKIKADGTSCDATNGICKVIKEKMKPWYEKDKRNLGLVNNPSTCCENGETCSCCYINQISCKASDLTVFINPKILLALESLRFDFNFDTPDFTTGLINFMNVGGLISIAEIPDDKIFIIHKKAIQINPVEGGKIMNSAEYPEYDLVNMWVEDKFHLTLWPYPCFTVKKPS